MSISMFANPTSCLRRKKNVTSSKRSSLVFLFKVNLFPQLFILIFIIFTTFCPCTMLICTLFLSTYSFIQGEVNLFQLVSPHNILRWSMVISWVYGLMDTLVEMLMKLWASRNLLEKQNKSQPT